MSECESPASSQVMNSSHSSEGSSIGGFVVVDKCDETVPNPDSSEDGTPAEIAAKTDSLALAGSVPQVELGERVQNLTKENEELKGVLLQNNKLLEEYFQDLANMQKSQKQTNESLRKGYDHAKEVVKKLREKNGILKTELKNEQNKNLQLEEQLSKLKDVKLNGPASPPDNAVQDDQGNPTQVHSLKEVIKRLESEKDTLETNNSKLQEHISCLKAMRESELNTETEDCETLISLESLTSDIQTSPELLQENYKKLETDKEILMVDLEKIKIEKEQKQQQCSQLEEERDKLLKTLADIEQRQTLEVADEKPEIIDTQAAAVASKQVDELCKQLEVQTEVLSSLKEELDAVKQENEMYKKKAEELEKGKETAENVDIESLKKQLQNYQVKEKEAQEAAGKQAALQAELTKETAELKQQLETQKEAVGKLKGDLDNLAKERDVYKRKAEELEMHTEETKKTAENVDIESLKKQLQNYQVKEKEAQEAADKQAALQAELAKETAELKQQLETQKEANGKLKGDLDNLTQERDAYKKKAEELEMHHPEETKGSGEESLGEAHVGDTDQKDKLIEKLKKQIWTYQKRDGDILNRENAVLEKEDEQKQLTEEKNKLEHRLAEALKEKETLSQERREQDEEAQSLKRQLSSVSDELSETREREVNQLKEELQNTSTAMTTAMSNAEQLKGNVTQLMEQNENLSAECEKLKADCSQKEEEVQSLKEQLNSVSSELNETREHEVNKLKEELTRKDDALAIAEASLEPLKVQVTQLIQDNESLAAERERIMDDYTQQENMYQDHLHKITEDSEKQRNKRDEIIRGLRKQVSALEVQLHNTQVKLEADSRVHEQLREEHEGVLTDYQELLQAYRTTVDANKHREQEENMTKAAYEAKVKELTGYLENEEGCRAKLKEDVRLREEELSDLRQDSYDLKKLQERHTFLEAQLGVYESDFKMERETREKQHEEILRLKEQVQRLTQENQRYQDEIDQLSNRGLAEMQRRHASFVAEPRDIQQQQQQEQPRGWFDGLMPVFARGPGDPSQVPNPEGEMGFPGRAQMGGDRREQRAPPAQEEDWQCPTCRRVFPNFDTLQIHAVECSDTRPPPAPAEHVQNQCPSCMDVFPDIDTLEIHVEECLDRNQ